MCGKELDDWDLNENYPLFYMFTVSAKEWYDGFAIKGSDC